MNTTIEGIQGLTPDQIQMEVVRGGRFVSFPFAVSLIVFSLKMQSKLYFLKAGEEPFKKGKRYILISLLLGWWGFPFGPVFTLTSIYHVLRGGIDRTEDVLVFGAQPR